MWSSDRHGDRWKTWYHQLCREYFDSMLSNIILELRTRADRTKSSSRVTIYTNITADISLSTTNKLLRFSSLLIKNILFSQRISRITWDANNARNLTNHIHSHWNQSLCFMQDHASRRRQHRGERPRRHHPEDDRGSWMHHRHAALQHTERGKKPWIYSDPALN